MGRSTRLWRACLCGVLFALAAASASAQSRTYQKIVTPATPGAAQFQHPTALALAPDGRIFFAQQNGKIHYAMVNSEFQVLGPVGIIDTIYNLGPSTGGRTVTGMTFGPNGDLFVSHSDGRVYDANVVTNSGTVTQLLASSDFTLHRDIVAGLPRSQGNHGPNGLAFGRDGKLYLAQGGMTNAGLPCREPLCIPSENPFYMNPEVPFSSAILQIDTRLSSYIAHATGFRNPYDLLFHSNGQLYANDNGANAGSGERIAGAGSCILSGAPVETLDELNLILPGKYYGHPNPSRGECWFGDGPSQSPIATYGLHTSSNGMAEYTSDVMAGLRGDIVTANFGTGNVVSVKLSPNGTTAVSIQTLMTGLANPLDVVVRSSDGAIFVAEYGAAGPAGSAISVLRVTSVSDFSGDRLTDLTVYRPSTGWWWVQTTNGNYTPYGWGLTDDMPKPIDYDGDAKTDLAVWRPSTGEWFIRTSSSDYSYASALGIQWGLPGDIPVPADFSGDGKTDLAVYRPSTGWWWMLTTGGSYTGVPWGSTEDVPRPIEYDGDTKADLAVWRPSTGEWQILTSSSGYSQRGALVIEWGKPGDIPVPADFDGDGKVELAVYRPSTGWWWVLNSKGRHATFPWGVAGDVPRPIDYDGDGKADIAVWRPSTGEWWILTSSTDYSYTRYRVVQWGLPGDIPVHPISD